MARSIKGFQKNLTGLRILGQKNLSHLCRELLILNQIQMSLILRQDFITGMHFGPVGAEATIFTTLLKPI
jgi:hypothetical protein